MSMRWNLKGLHLGWYGLVWAGMGHAWLVQSQLLTCINHIEFPSAPALAITVAKLLASCSTIVRGNISPRCVLKQAHARKQPNQLVINYKPAWYAPHTCATLMYKKAVQSGVTSLLCQAAVCHLAIWRAGSILRGLRSCKQSSRCTEQAFIFCATCICSWRGLHFCQESLAFMSYMNKRDTHMQRFCSQLLVESTDG